MVGLSGVGSTSLLLALLSFLPRKDGPVVVVGTANLGAGAALRLGVPLERLFLVPDPKEKGAALVEAVVSFSTAVVIAEDHPAPLPRGAVIKTKAKIYGTFLFLLAQGGLQSKAGQNLWPIPADLLLSSSVRNWVGIGRGWGFLGPAMASISIEDKRSTQRYKTEVWLPEAIPDGRPALGSLVS